MKFGICGGPDLAASAERACFDYMEWSVGAFLKPRESYARFADSMAAARRAGSSWPVVNCFIPADLKVTGDHVSTAELETYVTTACARAQEAGVETIVFGSGGARRIPEGFDGGRAHEQIRHFSVMAATVAETFGVTIAVEPLNRSECNVMTSVRECAALVREVNHPSLRLLVDAYHLMLDDDALEDVVANGDLLVHVHLATVPNRRPPGAEPCNFVPFFEALATAGYDGRVSLEGRISDPDAELPPARSMLEKLSRIQAQP